MKIENNRGQVKGGSQGKEVVLASVSGREAVDKVHSLREPQNGTTCELTHKELDGASFLFCFFGSSSHIEIQNIRDFRMIRET